MQVSVFNSSVPEPIAIRVLDGDGTGDRRDDLLTPHALLGILGCKRHEYVDGTGAGIDRADRRLVFEGELT